MRSELVVVLILAVASCKGAEIAEPLAAQDRSFSSVLLEFIDEDLRSFLQTGGGGVPVLAPLKASHKSLDISSGEFKIKGEVEDFVLQGLDGYEIVIMNLDLFRSRLTFELNFPSVNITTQYKADVGSGYSIQRSGGAFFALENLNIQGRISYSLGVISNNLRVKNILVYPSVGNVKSEIENLSKYRILNRKLNEIVEEFVSLTINDNTDYAANWVDELLTPVCNDLIGDRTLSDLIAIITGN
ncbi:uncharacterized protein [Drosophila bipectinata]|uniref:uncharacterized protein n=1 Tax=Drosophila bipectinata TaxID=42026 RepID=UPI001C8A16DA|nr:uncharacterized protein LOC108133365 [Drosophila bipectinata]